MLYIVLVDDEQLVIHHLVKLISTFDIPHKIVGTANNNQQALRIIRETHPNLIITDIRMGASNGLDLCDTLRVTMPHAKLIILSGFDDFGYAQKALRYNVFNYLLKPVNEKELYEQLSQVHGILREEKEAEAQDFLLKKQLLECLPLMQEWFFKIIRENLEDLEIIDSTFRLFGIDILNRSYQALYIDFSQDNDAQEIEKDFINVSKLAQTLMLFTVDSFKTIYFYDTGSITILLSSDHSDIETVQKEVYRIADRIRQYLDFNYEQPFSIGLSTAVQEIAYLRQSVKDALSASKYSFYIGFNEIICITDVELRSTGESLPNFKYIQEDLLKYLKLCDIPHTEQYLNIFYLNVLQLHGDRSLATNKFLELYYYLSNALNQEFTLSEAVLSDEIIRRLAGCTNLEDIKGIFSDYLKEVIQEIGHLRTNKSQKFIEKAKEYIRQNYAHDISLESIADEIGLSACYLSTLYKNIEKTSIKEYLIDVRIDASKKYLQDINLKIYEVAANVGYTDSRYFSQLFRKKTGYTPGQYREFIQET